MKLQESPVAKGSPYTRFTLSIPHVIVDALGWKQGIELEMTFTVTADREKALLIRRVEKKRRKGPPAG